MRTRRATNSLHHQSLRVYCPNEPRPRGGTLVVGAPGKTRRRTRSAAVVVTGGPTYLHTHAVDGPPG